MKKGIRVFVSYSHKDESFKTELEESLALLVRQGFLRIWHDRQIPVGSDIDDQIDENLAVADLILLLVSASFVASDYCYGIEMTQALKRHSVGEATVVPIVVRPCDLEGAPFAGLRMAPTDARAVTLWPDRDQAWADVTRSIRSLVTGRVEDAKSEGSTTQLEAQLRALLRHWESRGEQERALYGKAGDEILVEIARLEFELGKIKG